ncbi:MAG: ppm2, partial [Friedmanniella sp.]|nr:ppm2 [Friedmanniella sp.]
SALAAVLALGLLLGGGAALRHWQSDPAAGAAGSVNVGIVQGNVPGRGIAALGRARTVTNNHLAETVRLMQKVDAGELPRPDFVLWPENSTDIDPLLDAQTRATVQSAAGVAGRPILVGAVTEGPGVDERQTTALWWDPQRGPVAAYHKQNLVPFGEWIPFRAQLLPWVPILKEVGAQSIPGTAPGVLDVQAGGRDLRVGDVICFELAYDQTVYRSLTAGAQISVVQSNNATYGGTGQIEQQFAITRARAMESRREIAVATTDSVSGYIGRDGSVLHKTSQFTAASTVVSMPLRSELTPAIVAGPWIARGLAAVALLACLAGLAVGRTRPTRRAPEPGHPSGASTVGEDDRQAAPAGSLRDPVAGADDRERQRVD